MTRDRFLARSHARLAAVALAFVSSGCIALARESYTSLRGPQTAPLLPAERVAVSPGRAGSAFAQDPTAVRASAASAGVLVAVCDWDPGVWFVVFPPLPIPFLSPGDPPGIPDTTVVRVTLEGPGTWRATFAELALVGPEGARATPWRYRLVTPRKATTLGATPPRQLEPCDREDQEPKASVEQAALASFDGAELWLTFATRDWPEGPRALELRGLSRDGATLDLPRLELEPASRWFWYRFFP